MTSSGLVRVWQAEEGWGVIDSSVSPGGCWVHYSAVMVSGYKNLSTGQAMSFTFESADQDGYSFRAVEAWPSDRAPERPESVDTGRSSTYRSTLTLTFDTEDEGTH